MALRLHLTRPDAGTFPPRPHTAALRGDSAAVAPAPLPAARPSGAGAALCECPAPHTGGRDLHRLLADLVSRSRRGVPGVASLRKRPLSEPTGPWRRVAALGFGAALCAVPIAQVRPRRAARVPGLLGRVLRGRGGLPPAASQHLPSRAGHRGDGPTWWPLGGWLPRGVRRSGGPRAAGSRNSRCRRGSVRGRGACDAPKGGCCQHGTGKSGNR